MRYKLRSAKIGWRHAAIALLCALLISPLRDKGVSRRRDVQRWQPYLLAYHPPNAPAAPVAWPCTAPSPPQETNIWTSCHSGLHLKVATHAPSTEKLRKRFLAVKPLGSLSPRQPPATADWTKLAADPIYHLPLALRCNTQNPAITGFYADQDPTTLNAVILDNIAATIETLPDTLTALQEDICTILGTPQEQVTLTTGKFPTPYQGAKFQKYKVTVAVPDAITAFRLYSCREQIKCAIVIEPAEAKAKAGTPSAGTMLGTPNARLPYPPTHDRSQEAPRTEHVVVANTGPMPGTGSTSARVSAALREAAREVFHSTMGTYPEQVGCTREHEHDKSHRGLPKIGSYHAFHLGADVSNDSINIHHVVPRDVYHGQLISPAVLLMGTSAKCLLSSLTQPLSPIQLTTQAWANSFCIDPLANTYLPACRVSTMTYSPPQVDATDDASVQRADQIMLTPLMLLLSPRSVYPIRPTGTTTVLTALVYDSQEITDLLREVQGMDIRSIRGGWSLTIKPTAADPARAKMQVEALRHSVQFSPIRPPTQAHTEGIYHRHKGLGSRISTLVTSRPMSTDLPAGSALTTTPPTLYLYNMETGVPFDVNDTSTTALLMSTAVLESSSRQPLSSISETEWAQFNRQGSITLELAVADQVGQVLLLLAAPQEYIKLGSTEVSYTTGPRSGSGLGPMLSYKLNKESKLLALAVAAGTPYATMDSAYTIQDVRALKGPGQKLKALLMEAQSKPPNLLSVEPAGTPLKLKDIWDLLATEDEAMSDKEEGEHDPHPDMEESTATTRPSSKAAAAFAALQAATCTEDRRMDRTASKRKPALGKAGDRPSQVFKKLAFNPPPAPPPLGPSTSLPSGNPTQKPTTSPADSTGGLVTQVAQVALTNPRMTSNKVGLTKGISYTCWPGIITKLSGPEQHNIPLKVPKYTLTSPSCNAHSQPCWPSSTTQTTDPYCIPAYCLLTHMYYNGHHNPDHNCMKHQGTTSKITATTPTPFDHCRCSQIPPTLLLNPPLSTCPPRGLRHKRSERRAWGHLPVEEAAWAHESLDRSITPTMGSIKGPSLAIGPLHPMVGVWILSWTAYTHYQLSHTLDSALHCISACMRAKPLREGSGSIISLYIPHRVAHPRTWVWAGMMYSCLHRQILSPELYPPRHGQRAPFSPSRPLCSQHICM